MKRFTLLIALLFCTTSAQSAEDYPVKPVEFPNVKLKDGFWAPRQKINREHSIPFAFEQCEKTGRIDNFKLVYGEAPEGYRYTVPVFNDTDIYKGIEAASFDMAVNPNPEMDAYVDELIEIVGKAQEADGYLYTAISSGQDFPDLHSWAGGGKWKHLQMSHELYNAGHLFEAATAHHVATGKDNFLNIATKLADMLVKTFGPGKEQIQDVPGHQVVEMGLVKLYRVTGKKEYLDLAKFFVDMRGRSDLRNGRDTNPKLMYGEYAQDHKPVVRQDEAVGHAVRATYFYAGAADVAVLCEDAETLAALKAIWDNVVSKKLAITGGYGSSPHGEAFAGNYVLRNFVDETYNETCAQIGGCYWQHRMFLLDPDAKYYDVLERTIYNGLISGVSLSGDRFFYPNPLASKGGYDRMSWFGCACCPQNLMRFVASLGGYVYSVKNDTKTGETLYVGLYISNDAVADIGNNRVKLDMRSGFPADGNVVLKVGPEKETEWTLALRIPGWASGKPVPSELYHYAEPDRDFVLKSPPVVKVNGETFPNPSENGFVSIKRRWKKDDEIHLEFPMPVLRVLCDDRVADNRDRVAVEKGPLVFCCEGCDNGDAVFLTVIDVVAKSLHPKISSTPELNDAEMIEMDAEKIIRAKDGSLTREKVRAKMIPYAVWNNRGDGNMQVWMSRNENSVTPPMRFSPAISASFVRDRDGMNRRLTQVYDGETPTGGGKNVVNFDWWPRKGTTEWIQYEFKEPATITKSRVFWFDDTGRGECRLPVKWRILHKNGDQWNEVILKDSVKYVTVKDAPNTIEFEPVTTDAIRLEATLPEGFSGGVYEWDME